MVATKVYQTCGARKHGHLRFDLDVLSKPPSSTCFPFVLSLSSSKPADHLPQVIICGTIPVGEMWAHNRLYYDVTEGASDKARSVYLFYTRKCDLELWSVL